MSRLPVFLSAPYACGYLDERTARTAFIDPREAVNTATYSRLAQIGFRRSGPFLYRPACHGCQACQSARVVVAAFQPNRAQRRCRQRNADLQSREFRPQANTERYLLYQRYLSRRHPEGEMDPADREGFERFLGDSWCNTRHVDFRLGETLLATLVYDELSDGLSAVYSFFDPDLPRRSLGRHLVLWLIEQARERGLAYVYLGYWIAGCRKMNYKTEYQPLQIFTAESWQDWIAP